MRFKLIGCTYSRLLILHAELAKHIKDMEILITTPFHPAYMTKERLENASKLKLIMTAGVGSDHIDLKTAADKGMTVVEVSGVQTKSAAGSLHGSLQFGMNVAHSQGRGIAASAVALVCTLYDLN